MDVLMPSYLELPVAEKCLTKVFNERVYGAYVFVIVMYSPKIISKKNYFRDFDIAEKTANRK